MQSKNQNDSVQFPTRYWAYDLAKRNLGGFGGRQVFPFLGNGEPTHLKYVGAVMSERNQKWLEDGKQFSRNFPQGQRVYGTDGISSTIASQAGGLGAKTGLYASTQEKNAREVLRVLQGKIGKEAFTKWGLGILDSLQGKEVLRQVLHEPSLRTETEEGRPELDDGTLSRKEPMPESELLLLWKSKNGRSPQEPRLAGQFIEELSESLSQLPQSDTPWSIRRLTPTEAERLQGFPDGWAEGISDTQRYKCLGNAVTVNVIRDIMVKLLNN